MINKYKLIRVILLSMFQYIIGLLSNNYVLLFGTIMYSNQFIYAITPLFHLIIHYLFEYNYYDIQNKDNKIKILKNLNNYYCFSYDENDNPYGHIIEKSFFPKFYMNIDRDEYIFNIFCKRETLYKLINDNFEKKEIKLNDDFVPTDEKKGQIEKKTDELIVKKEITYMCGSQHFGDGFFTERRLNLNTINSNIEFNHKQDALFKKIMIFYKKNNYCTAFISGKPGQGKTYFSYIMAQKMGCYLCDSYKPTEPGTFINTFYHKAKKISPTKPFIIIMDEIDICIEDLKNNSIQQHKSLKTEIYNKITWNNLFDKISYGMYPYLIIVMTTNKDKSYIDKIDNAYLREGRVNVFDKW